MKAYVYTEAELNLKRFSDGILRLNCEITRDPLEADVFVCPEPLFKFVGVGSIEDIPYMTDYPERHVFLDLSEHFTTYRQRSCMFIRAALTDKMKEFGPNSIAWPWPVDNFIDCINSSDIRYRISFRGWGSNLARKVAAKSCKDVHKEHADIDVQPGFYGYQDPATQQARRNAYKDSIRQSAMLLTVESIPGVIPYRFYEAMSAGRVQLYVGANYNLPFEREIPYDDFVLKLNTDSADEAGERVMEWYSSTKLSTVIEKGLEARHYWEKFLDRDQWIATMTYAVGAKLRSMGIIV